MPVAAGIGLWRGLRVAAGWWRSPCSTPPDALPSHARGPGGDPRMPESRRFILGPAGGGVRAGFADRLGCGHVIGVANGTDALTIALHALGVGPGDDVVVPSFTFSASAEAIPHLGARPVFCDIDPDTFCVTRGDRRRGARPDTQAVVAVDLFGSVPPALAARRPRHGGARGRGTGRRRRRQRAAARSATSRRFVLPLQEPFASATPARSPPTTASGRRARVLRFHGPRDKTDFELGYGRNSRLDALQAALLRVHAEHGWTGGRSAPVSLAAAYSAAGLGEVVATAETRGRRESRSPPHVRDARRGSRTKLGGTTRRRGHRVALPGWGARPPPATVAAWPPHLRTARNGPRGAHQPRPADGADAGRGDGDGGRRGAGHRPAVTETGCKQGGHRGSAPRGLSRLLARKIAADAEGRERPRSTGICLFRAARRREAWWRSPTGSRSRSGSIRGIPGRVPQRSAVEDDRVRRRRQGS